MKTDNYKDLSCTLYTSFVLWCFLDGLPNWSKEELNAIREDAFVWKKEV